MTTFETAQCPYFVGIGGIGVSAIARFFQQRGRPVHGTDVSASVITDGLHQTGTDITVGEPPLELPPDTDLVVASDAVPPDHPLCQSARSRGVPWLTYAEALGALTRPYPQRVVVTGTNGKSTTTAMVAWLLVRAKRDPTVVVGSLIPQLGGNYRAGASGCVVVEGDDYRDHFLQLRPTHTLVTNVAFDHPDAFRDLADVQAHMEGFLERLEPSGTLILNADDRLLEPLRRRHPEALTFSCHPQSNAALILKPTTSRSVRQQFSLIEHGTQIGQGKIQLPGRHNLANAAGAALLGRRLGLSATDICEGLSSFQGLWRRFEIVVARGDRVVVSDYAHHPDSVRAIITAAKDSYPGWRIVVVFQPHHEARLLALEAEFADALSLADDVVVVEVYRVAGRTRTEPVSAAALATAIEQRHVSTQFVPTLDEALVAARQRLLPQTVLLVAGAGSIDRVARSLA